MRVAELFAACFCLAWGLALFAFPHLKAAPSGYLPVFLGIGLVISADRSGWLSRIAAWSAAMGPDRYLSAVLIATTLVRIAAILVFPLEPKMDDEQFHRYAVNMLSGEGYGAPAHRAFFPPGMSFVLSGWYWLVGPSVMAGKLLQVLFSVLLVWQTWATASLLWCWRRSGTNTATARRDLWSSTRGRALCLRSNAERVRLTIRSIWRARNRRCVR